MDDLDKLSTEIGGRLERRSRLQFLSSLAVKIVLVVGGATIATVAQLAPGPQHWSIVGIGGALLAFIGGALVAFVDSDASKDLESARRALSKAQQYEDDLVNYEQKEAILTRATELYASMSLMREAIEQMLNLKDGVQPEKAAALCLVVSARGLATAMGFLREEHFTVCIYVADRSNDAAAKTMLRLIAHERTVPCDVGAARKWPDGIGVTGASYATASEIIIPDLLAPELGSAFTLKGNMTTADLNRYRSIVAVPILLDGNSTPWGVVTATSGRAGRFSTGADAGVQSAEGARALAGMVALAVTAVTRVKT